MVEGPGVERVTAAHAHGIDSSHPAFLEGHPAWASVVRRVVATGEGELGWFGQPVPFRPDDDEHLAVMEALGQRSWVCVPLRVQAGPVGAISYGTAGDRRGFRPSDLATATELATRTAVALEGIALHRQTRRAAEEAERRAVRLRRLVEAALALPARPGVHDVAALVSQQACRVLGAGLSVVGVERGARITATDGVWGPEHDRLLALAQEAEPEVVIRVADPDSGSVAALATRLGGDEDHPAVTVGVARPAVGSFGDEDESVLLLLARLTSVAVDNAHLYETVLAGREHLQALVEAAPLAILEFGPDRRLRQANSAARALFGPGATGGGAEPAFHPETAGVLDQIVADTVAGAAVAGAEAQARRADGTDLALSLFGAPLRDRAGEIDGVLVLAADVTARRDLEEHLVRARRIEAVGQVAGGVAHDFNNLLTVVLGHATVLGVLLPADHAGRADVEAITLAAERAAGITSQLLTISRGDLVMPEVFDPRLRLGGLADTLRSVLPSPVDLVMDITPGEGWVRMSAAQFDQVMLNLAVNARDAMPDGGSLSVRLGEVAGAVLVTVADTGVGMDATTAERCFEPFFTTKGGRRGTGLGLATVQSVISGAGGEVKVSSEPGKGTTFSLRLPRVAEAAEAAAPAPAPAPAPGPRVGEPGWERILVVENEDGLRRLAVEVLRSAGYAVTAAPDGRAALEAVAAEVPDLVVSDVVMPRMSGPELARCLSEDHPALPVLFMTGYVDQASRDSLHGADVLIKPFTVEDLVARVGELLERARAAAAVRQASPEDFRAGSAG